MWCRLRSAHVWTQDFSDPHYNRENGYVAIMCTKADVNKTFKADKDLTVCVKKMLSMKIGIREVSISSIS